MDITITSDSVAMNYYAQPRMTRDIDLVVALQPGDAERIVALFEPDYYVPHDAAVRAIARRSMFNLIHDVDGFIRYLEDRASKAIAANERPVMN